MAKITIKIKFAWWYRYFYFPGIILGARFLMAMGVDLYPSDITQNERFKYWTKKATRMKVLRDGKECEK